MKISGIIKALIPSILIIIFLDGCEREWINPLSNNGSSSRKEPSADSLVAYYPFNGNANDESGNGNDGIIYGAKLTKDRFGVANRAYSFDGIVDYLKTSFTPNNVFSLSIWYNKANLQKENAGLFSTYSGGSNYNGIYYSMNGTTDWVRCDGNSLNSYNSSAQNWNHIVIVSDGTKVKLYQNANKKLDFNGTTKHTNNIIFGDSRYNGRYFTGEIDDIRIYKRAISEEEIQTLYHEGGWSK